MPERSPLRSVLFAAITLAPIVIAGLAPWMVHKQLLPAADLTWFVVACLLFSILGFAGDRLISIKFPGIEARLAEIQTATNNAYASIAEVNRLKNGILELAGGFARQQALLIMRANRIVGENHLTERVHSLSELKAAVSELGVSESEAESILKEAAPYVRNDLGSDLRSELWEAVTQSARAEQSGWQDPKKLEELREEIGCLTSRYETAGDASSIETYLEEHRIQTSDAIQKAVARLGAFLNAGHYLDMDGNVVLTFPIPRHPLLTDNTHSAG